MDEITVTASELEGRLESILEGLPTELIVTHSERTRLQEALNTVAGVGPILDELTPAILELEQSITRIASLPDELEATYTPEFLRAEADRRARRLVREAPGHRTGSPPQRPRRSNPHDSPKNLGVS